MIRHRSLSCLAALHRERPRNSHPLIDRAGASFVRAVGYFTYFSSASRATSLMVLPSFSARACAVGGQYLGPLGS